MFESVQSFDTDALHAMNHWFPASTDVSGSSWNDVLRGALVCLPQRRGDNTIRALGAWLFLARQFGWHAGERRAPGRCPGAQ